MIVKRSPQATAVVWAGGHTPSMTFSGAMPVSTSDGPVECQDSR